MSKRLSFLQRIPVDSLPNTGLQDLTQLIWKLMSKQTPAWNVYGSFVCNHPKLEATKMSINRWVGNKLWLIQLMEYYSGVKKDKLPSCKMTQRNLRCVLLCERSQSEKVSYCMIPVTRHSGKGKTRDRKKRWSFAVVARGWPGVKTGRNVKQFCRTLGLC